MTKIALRKRAVGGLTVEGLMPSIQALVVKIATVEIVNERYIPCDNAECYETTRLWQPILHEGAHIEPHYIVDVDFGAKNALVFNAAGEGIALISWR